MCMYEIVGGREKMRSRRVGGVGAGYEDVRESGRQRVSFMAVGPGKLD